MNLNVYIKSNRFRIVLGLITLAICYLVLIFRDTVRIVLVNVFLGFSLISVIYSAPPHIDTIKVKDIANWSLSPEGDKIIYNTLSSGPSTLFFTEAVIFRYRELDLTCEPFWISTSLLICQGPVLLDTNSFKQIPVQTIENSALDAEKLLKGGSEIYLLNWDYKPSKILILENEYPGNQGEAYLIEKNDNINSMLTEHPYSSFLLNQSGWVVNTETDEPVENKIDSPDENYFYRKESSNSLAIYDTRSSEKIVEYSDYCSIETIGGWASDSSGVYFSVLCSVPTHSKIFKLEIP